MLTVALRRDKCSVKRLYWVAACHSGGESESVFVAPAVCEFWKKFVLAGSEFARYNLVEMLTFHPQPSDVDGGVNLGQEMGEVSQAARKPCLAALRHSKGSGAGEAEGLSRRLRWLRSYMKLMRRRSLFALAARAGCAPRLCLLCGFLHLLAGFNVVVLGF